MCLVCFKYIYFITLYKVECLYMLILITTVLTKREEALLECRCLRPQVYSWCVVSLLSKLLANCEDGWAITTRILLECFLPQATSFIAAADVGVDASMRCVYNFLQAFIGSWEPDEQSSRKLWSRVSNPYSYPLGMLMHQATSIIAAADVCGRFNEMCIYLQAFIGTREPDEQTPRKL